MAFAGVAVVASPVFEPMTPGYQGAALAREGSTTYELAASGGGVTVTGNAAAGGSTRTVYWPVGQAPLARAQSCATWSAQVGPVVQQGLALRIRQGNKGTARAITVTKNIFTTDPQIAGTWSFNVHVWRPSGLVHVANFNLPTIFSTNGRPRPLPWRVCARVQGRLLMFQAWREGQVRPTWDNPDHGGSVTLPPGSGYAGQTGWYIGHLGTGNSATFTKLYAGAPTATLP